MNKSRRLEVGKCNNYHNLEDKNNSLKKCFNRGLTMMNPKLLANKNNRRELEIEELRMTELRFDHDPWCIKNKLFKSDAGDMVRLMLASELVESHILSH
ncbi:hypothetical protein V6N13_120829 [Hibiscus sabdariffa]|uniref:Uncharacterized protein n=1 Tax=Hibiscus sabdariffa TaxID=183260 RepID=A0ABR2E6Z0_9ROSI